MWQKIVGNAKGNVLSFQNNIWLFALISKTLKIFRIFRRFFVCGEFAAIFVNFLVFVNLLVFACICLFLWISSNIRNFQLFLTSFRILSDWIFINFADPLRIFFISIRINNKLHLNPPNGPKKSKKTHIYSNDDMNLFIARLIRRHTAVSMPFEREKNLTRSKTTTLQLIQVFQHICRCFSAVTQTSKREYIIIIQGKQHRWMSTCVCMCHKMRAWKRQLYDTK